MTKVAGVLLGLAAALGAGSVAAAGADEPPAGLTRDDWSQIRGTIQGSGYHARPMAKPGDAAAFQAPNRQQAYRTTFRRDGIEINMPLHDSGTELFLEDFSSVGDMVSNSLDVGQAVVMG